MVTQKPLEKPKVETLRIAFPQQEIPVGQDAEWCVVSNGGPWKEMRFHDYGSIFEVEGLYEKIFLSHLQSRSHVVMAESLAQAVRQSGSDLSALRILDLGAGNGHVAGHLRALGARHLYGLDILPEARQAAERDHPQVYRGYSLVSENWREAVRQFAPDCLICVAALGFGDIGVKLFDEIVEGLAPGALVAFNIKEQFLNALDPSGFNQYFQQSVSLGRLTPLRQWRHFHRFSTWGDRLHYLGVVARRG